MGVKAEDVGNSGFLGPPLRSPIVRNSSWFFNNTGSSPHAMDEDSNQILGHLDNTKSTGSMNLEELFQNMSNADIEQSNFSMQMDSMESSALPLRRQGSLLANCVTRSKKTSDEIWKEIQEGEVAKDCTMVKTEKDLMTLEDYLAKNGGCSREESFVSSTEYKDQIDTSRSFSAHINLSPAPSIGVLSDSPLTGCKRGAYDSTDPVDRKLKRKIKNRESAARSRARKQAYHNELVSKVSCLELDNFKLKKEKKFDQLFSRLDEKKYQLRRTSSTSF